MSQPVHFAVHVESVVRHDADTATYELRYEGRRPRFRAGQFVHLALDEYSASRHWPESRVFSIASAPSRTDGLRLTIGRQGRFTGRILDEVQAGRRLWLKGPYGDFVLAPAPPGESVAMVAGGTGITPFCSLLEELAVACTPVASPLVLHYGARTPALLVYRGLAERCRGEFRTVLYAESGACDGIVAGRIDAARVLASVPDPRRARFFLSGPRAMIDALRPALVAGGAPPDRVVSDDWQ